MMARISVSRIVLAFLMGLLVIGQVRYAAAETGWMLRARGIVVIPDESATIEAIGGDAAIDTAVMPEIDISYFFTESLAVELILATTPHDVTAVGTQAGDVPVGDIMLLPPTLLAQYHLPMFNRVKPYVGAGINYTIFYDSDAAGGTVTAANYKNSFGFALQAGIDIFLTEKFFLNVDLKKLFLDTRVDLTVPPTVNGGSIRADVDIDPWILGFGFGYKF